MKKTLENPYWGKSSKNSFFIGNIHVIFKIHFFRWLSHGGVEACFVRPDSTDSNNIRIYDLKSEIIDSFESVTSFKCKHCE